MPTIEEAGSPNTPQHKDGGEDPATQDGSAPPDSAPNLEDTLSPAVRRLVRQFDLDVTGIHGSGPSGRLKVGDIMSLLEGRKDTGKRDAPQRAAAETDAAQSGHHVGPLETAPTLEAALEPETAAPEPPVTTEPAAHAAVPTTTVFDCDVTRALSHRRRLRKDGVELLTTSYFLTALATALEQAPEMTRGQLPRFGVSLTTSDGERTSALEVPETLPESPDARVRAMDTALRANLHTPLEHSNLLVHHYGESGSLLATPTPIGAGHVASVGIGRIRRDIVVRFVDGVETPRVAACCHVSLSFLPDRVRLHDANRTLGDAVAILEAWPE